MPILCQFYAKRPLQIGNLFFNICWTPPSPPPLSINVQRNCTFGIGIICIAPPREKKTFPVHPYKFPWVHPPSMRTNRKKATMLRDGDLGWSEMEMPWWWMGLRARYWCRGMRDCPAWGEVRDGLAGRSGKKCSLIIGAWFFRIFCNIILALYDDHHITIVPFVHLWGFNCVQYFSLDNICKPPLLIVVLILKVRRSFFLILVLSPPVGYISGKILISSSGNNHN